MVGAKECVWDLCVSGGCVFGGSEDGLVHCWDAIRGTYLRSFPGHTAGVLALCSVKTEASAELIVSGSADGCIKVWDSLTGIEQASMQRPAGAVTSLCAETIPWDLYMEQANQPLGRIILGDSAGKLEAWSLSPEMSRSWEKQLGVGVTSLLSFLDASSVLVGTDSSECLLVLTRPRPTLQRQAVASPSPVRADTFDDYDTNGDGVIERHEFEGMKKVVNPLRNPIPPTRHRDEHTTSRPNQVVVTVMAPQAALEAENHRLQKEAHYLQAELRHAQSMHGTAQPGDAPPRIVATSPQEKQREEERARELEKERTIRTMDKVLGVEDELPALVVELPRFAADEKQPKRPGGREPWFSSDNQDMQRSRYQVGMLLLKPILAKLMRSHQGKKLRIWRRNTRDATERNEEEAQRLTHSAKLAEALVSVAMEAIEQTSGMDEQVTEWKSLYEGLETKFKLRETQMEDEKAALAATVGQLQAAQDILESKLVQKQDELTKQAVRSADKDSCPPDGDSSVLAAVQAAVIQGLVLEAVKKPEPAPLRLIEGDLLSVEALPSPNTSHRDSGVSIQLPEEAVDASSAQSTPRSARSEISTASRLSLKDRVTIKANQRRMSLQTAEVQLAEKDQEILMLRAQLQLAGEQKEARGGSDRPPAASRRGSLDSDMSATSIGSRVSAKAQALALKEKVDRKELEVKSEQLELEVAELKRDMKEMRTERKDLEAAVVAAEEKYHRKCREHEAQMDENSELESDQAEKETMLRDKLAKVEAALGQIDQSREQEREKLNQKLQDLIKQNEAEKQELRGMYGASEEDAERHQYKLDALINDKADLERKVEELQDEISDNIKTMGEVKGEIRVVKEAHQADLDAVNHVYETALEDNAHLMQKNEGLEKAVASVTEDSRKGATLLMKQAVGRLRFRDLASKLFAWRDAVERERQVRLESKLHESTLAAKSHQGALEAKKAEMQRQLEEQASDAAADIQAKEEAQASAEKLASDSQAALQNTAAETQAAWEADMQHTVKEYETAMASLQNKLRAEKHNASMRLMRQFIGQLRHHDVMLLLRYWRSVAYKSQIDTAADRFETLVTETEHRLNAAQKETDAKVAEVEQSAEDKVTLAERDAAERVAAVQKDAEKAAAEVERAAAEAIMKAAEDKVTMKDRMEAMKKAQVDEVWSER